MSFMKCFTDSRTELHSITSNLFICEIKQLTYSNFHDIKRDIACLPKKICDSLENASKHCIPSNNIDYYKNIFNTVPCFNEHVKELDTIARHDYIAWRSASQPHFGGNLFVNESIKLRCKSSLNFCQHSEKILVPCTLFIT